MWKKLDFYQILVIFFQIIAISTLFLHKQWLSEMDATIIPDSPCVAKIILLFSFNTEANLLLLQFYYKRFGENAMMKSEMNMLATIISI